MQPTDEHLRQMHELLKPTPEAVDRSSALLAAGHRMQNRSGSPGFDSAAVNSAAARLAGGSKFTVTANDLTRIGREVGAQATETGFKAGYAAALAAKSASTEAAQDAGILQAMAQHKHETEAGHRAIDGQEHSTAAEKTAQHARLQKKHTETMDEYRQALKAPAPYDATKAGQVAQSAVAIANPKPNPTNAREHAPFLTTNRAPAPARKAAIVNGLANKLAVDR